MGALYKLGTKPSIFIVEQAKHSEWPVSVELNMVRTEELFIRSAELAVFTSIMRTHEGRCTMQGVGVYFLKRDI